MEALLTWSLKSSALLVVVFACYFFLFRNNTVFKLRRSLLLLILALSCLAPLVEFEIAQDRQPGIVQQAVQFKINAIEQIKLTPAEVSFQTPTMPEEKSEAIKWQDVVLYTYAAGIVVSLALLLFELSKVFYLRFTSQRDHTMGRSVYRHRGISSPFSFHCWMFIPMEAKYEGSTWKIISTHEQTHIQKRHSLDLIFSRLIQSLLWFNPIIYLLQKELRSVHEAQADEHVLQTTGFNTYAQALMQVSLPGYQLPIGHSFAVISSFSKRLKLMKTHKTKRRTTIISVLAISVFSFGLIGWSSMRGQEKKGFQDFYSSTENSPERQEAFQRARERFRQMIPYMITNKLSDKHKKIMELLEEENPEKNIRFTYFSESNFKSYYDNFIPGYSPLYISKLSDDDKANLTDIYMSDSTVMNISGAISYGNDGFFFQYKDFIPDVSEAISGNVNYLMIYEYVYNPTEYDDTLILDINEVDQPPQVMGGIENLAKTIALDISMPKGLDRSRVPETIDFEFVVQGGQKITHINLLTELKGSDKKNAPYYKFFGEVHNTFRSKISSLYAWKRGMKNGKEVLVRMKISIPTKYMM